MKKVLFTLFLLLFTLTLCAQASIKYTSTNLNLRKSPNSNSKILSVLSKGTKVKLEQNCKCTWILVSYNGKTGYVSSKYLTDNKNLSSSKKNITNTKYPTKATNTKTTADVKYYTNSQGKKVQSPTKNKSAPAGATALCRDGTYSFSQNRRGTCSHHGGVARWL